MFKQKLAVPIYVVLVKYNYDNDPDVIKITVDKKEAELALYKECVRMSTVTGMPIKKSEFLDDSYEIGDYYIVIDIKELTV